MNGLLTSSLTATALLGLAACAETTVTDYAPLFSATSVDQAHLGRALLVVETATPQDDPERDRLAAEGDEVVRRTLAQVTAAVASPDNEERLLGQARASSLDSVLIVRIEGYARRGHLAVGIAVPPVIWDTQTVVSLRVRAIDVRTGTVIADLRRDRVRGGLFTLRSRADLPSELEDALGSVLMLDGSSRRL